MYCNTNPAATTRYKVSHKGQEEDHKSSGIWVSTPLGSTAAINAAGASPLEATQRDCQYWVRELYQDPNGSYQLQQGVFDPSSDVLEIENYCRDAIVALDGHHAQISMGFASKVRFHSGPDLSLVLDMA